MHHGMARIRPVFAGVVDLGLRDVGVRNDRRRLGAYLAGGAVLFLLVALTLSVVVVLLADRADVPPGVLGVTSLVILMGLLVGLLRRMPLYVVRYKPQASAWPVVLIAACLVAAGLLLRHPLFLVLAAQTVVLHLVLSPLRGRNVQALGTARERLAAGEVVLGDGMGSARREPRVVLVTDRRLIVAGPGGRLLLDEPHANLERFGFEWKRRGGTGQLTLHLRGGDTHVVSAMPPPNLVSIADALLSSGVPAGDPAAVREAVEAWEAARQKASRRRR